MTLDERVAAAKAHWEANGYPVGPSLAQWQKVVYEAMGEKGFHAGRTGDGRDDTLVRLALVHTEVSEAAQVVKRQGLTDSNRDEFADELADIVIRVLDLAGCAGVGLEGAVARKMAKNLSRPFRYGTPDEWRS